ncbi:hypothetical protein OEZ86_010426 [Tetradesmus obliquus]|nr:hypothetical protein OEZ86_010426 [Tetradesmus obliquus]
MYTCKDIDGCANTPCSRSRTANSNQICTDVRAPKTGYTCGCDPGYTWDSGTVACIDINGCADGPCSKSRTPNSDETCTDVRAPLTGYVCGCTAGYTWDSGTASCIDINGCADGPCSKIRTPNSDETCTDVRAPLTGYVCGCTAGYTWDSGTASCIDINGCTDSPCSRSRTPNSDEVCTDVRAPLTGYTCGCITGYAWDSGTAACIDADGCADGAIACTRMTGSTRCYDVPAPGTGYACGCTPTYWWTGTVCKSITGTECVRVVAGITDVKGTSFSGISATGSTFDSPNGVSVDTSGNMYIADTGNGEIRKVTKATGIVSTIIGLTEPGFSTQHVLVRPNGDLYFVDYSRNVFSYSASGNVGGYKGSGISFTSLAYDAVANKVVAFAANNGGNTGQVYSFPMDLKSPSIGTTGSATYPPGIAVNPGGIPFVAAGEIQKVENNVWSDYNDGSTTAANDVDVTTAVLSAYALAFNAAGDMLVSDSERNAAGDPVRCRVWLVRKTTGKLKLVVGSATLGACGSYVETVRPSANVYTLMGPPGAVAFAATGRYAYIADPSNHRVLMVDLNCV